MPNLVGGHDLFAYAHDSVTDQESVISEQIALGAQSASGDFAVDLDRRSAIRRLFARARPGDAVLLAGKGHEQRMVVGDQRPAWNDAASGHRYGCRRWWWKW